MQSSQFFNNEAKKTERFSVKTKALIDYLKEIVDPYLDSLLWNIAVVNKKYIQLLSNKLPPEMCELLKVDAAYHGDLLKLNEHDKNYPEEVAKLLKKHPNSSFALYEIIKSEHDIIYKTLQEIGEKDMATPEQISRLENFQAQYSKNKTAFDKIGEVLEQVRPSFLRSNNHWKIF